MTEHAASVDPERPLVLGHETLTLHDITDVARRGRPVGISDDPDVLGRVKEAHSLLERWAHQGRLIYGVATAFGGLADKLLSRADAVLLQNRSVRAHKTGAGATLPVDFVRAGMLLRLNSHLKGHSGVREELMRRLQLFLNEGITPRVRELGSIGASGDLVPLNYICGCVIGAPGFHVEKEGTVTEARDAIARLGLAPMELGTREGLAMMNGTSLSAGAAALLSEDAQRLLNATMAFHALAFQALDASDEPLHPFIHSLKPHPGQVWTANVLRSLLDGSDFVHTAPTGSGSGEGRRLIQDRYSLRCAPQYLGPLVEDLAIGEERVLLDANGCSDNPLIDIDRETVLHGGNFLGQYLSHSVDSLRWCLGMMAKHVDAQIALMMSPEFSNGLPPSLIGNGRDPANIGLKGLQLTGNSIVGLLLHSGASVADRFPTYAEQHNQNLNSQSLGACLLGRDSVDRFRIQVSVGILICIQALDLRSYRDSGSYDPRPRLSRAGCSFYERLRAVLESPIRADRPFVWNDDDRDLEDSLRQVAGALGEDELLGEILDAPFEGGSLGSALAAL